MSGDSESTFNPKMCDKYLGTLGNTYLNCLESSGAKFPPFKQESLGTLTQDDVEIEYGFTYRKSTIRQLKIRGSYGRYITFWGRSVNDYSGTPGYYNPGSPGSIAVVQTHLDLPQQPTAIVLAILLLVTLQEHKEAHRNVGLSTN